MWPAAKLISALGLPAMRGTLNSPTAHAMRRSRAGVLISGGLGGYVPFAELCGSSRHTDFDACGSSPVPRPVRDGDGAVARVGYGRARAALDGSGPSRCRAADSATAAASAACGVAGTHLPCCVCVLLAAVDLRHRRLPAGVVLWSYPLLAALLLIAALAHHEISAWGRAVAAAVAVGLVMHLVPNHIIGHGDAKLLGLLIMMPAWFGLSAVLPALLVFFVPVAAESVALLATGRAKRGDQIAFGPPLMAGAYLYLLVTGKSW